MQCAGQLTDTCDDTAVTDGVEDVQDDVRDLVDRWNKINRFYSDRRTQVLEAEKAVKKYRSLIMPLENSVKRAEKKLDDFEYEGIELAEGQKLLETLKVHLFRLINFGIFCYISLIRGEAIVRLRLFTMYLEHPQN